MSEKLPFHKANLREFWFASTLGANSEILKEAAKCSTFTLAIWLSAHIPVKIQLPAAREAVTRQSFSFQLDKTKLQAAQQRDGHYLLRSNLTSEDPAVLWTRYVQLTQIESVFRSLKSELGIRPIDHQLQHRAEAHVLIAFLAYCLQVTLKSRLMIHAPGLTAPAVLEKLATIQMVEVWIPHRGWPLAGATASHPAGERCSSSAGSDPHHSPSATSTPHQSPFSSAIEDGRRHWPTCFVVKTFQMPLLILKNLSKA